MGVVTAQTAAAKRSPDSEIVMSRTTLTSPKLQCAVGTGGISDASTVLLATF